MEETNTNNHNEHEKTIIVNTREKKWGEETISYDQVIKLAFDTYSEDESIVYTVNWTKGHDEGSLVKGQSVEVKNGMIFNVTSTNKS